MKTTAWIVSGAVLALPLLALAGRRRRPEKMLATGLLVATLTDVSLAIRAEAGPAWTEFRPGHDRLRDRTGRIC